MILHTVLLENFGQYGGRYEINLAPAARVGTPKPIILIGGHNGAGKTTLLEAVRLALYGRLALGDRVAQSEYDQYIRERLHRNAPDGQVAPSVAVGVDFDYSEGGTVHRYTAKRSWHIRGKTVVESLDLLVDGVPLSTVPRDEWHGFLQELIPPGVSKLFFFDGEKIQQIAESVDGAEQLAEAVRGLLGIELIARLRTDLGLYLARQERSRGSVVSARLEAVVGELAELGRQLADCASQVAELSTTRDSRARLAERVRSRFVSEGGEVSARRVELERKRAVLEERSRSLESELRDQAARLLPFAVAPKLCRAFLDGSAKTKGLSPADRAFAAKDISAAFRDWTRSSKVKKKADWTSSHRNDFDVFIHEWQLRAALETTSRVALFASAGPAMGGLLTEALSHSRERAQAIAEDLESIGRELYAISTEQSRIDVENIDVLLKELQLAEQEVGAAENALQAETERMGELKRRAQMLEKERASLLQQQVDESLRDGRMGLAGKVGKVLADYERSLVDLKLEQLRREFVQCFSRLAHKHNLITDVRVNRETFGITMIDARGRELPLSQLSAGERQIFAVSVLWALARTSKRSLPMFIDTPLARLDSAHRLNVISKYLPAASHQVILLSTDTELDERLYAPLKDHISHTFRLELDPTLGRTKLMPGYFFHINGANELPYVQQA